MAVLPDADRIIVHKKMEDEEFNQLRASTGLSRADMRAAINGIDDFLNANAAAINTAIPQPARAALTVQQKAKLLVFVVERRYLSGV